MNLAATPENRTKLLTVYSKFLLEKRDDPEKEPFLLHPDSITYFPALAGYNRFLVSGLYLNKILT